MGHVLVMGRLTFESIGRALPGRRTIVVTRNRYWQHADVEVAHSFAEALALAGPADEVFVCGGGEVYAEAMPWAHRLLITEVFLEPEGDVVFPPIPFDEFVETARETRDRLAWVTYERRARPDDRDRTAWPDEGSQPSAPALAAHAQQGRDRVDDQLVVLELGQARRRRRSRCTRCPATGSGTHRRGPRSSPGRGGSARRRTCRPPGTARRP